MLCDTVTVETTPSIGQIVNVNLRSSVPQNHPKLSQLSSQHIAFMDGAKTQKPEIVPATSAQAEAKGNQSLFDLGLPSRPHWIPHELPVVLPFEQATKPTTTNPPAMLWSNIFYPPHDWHRDERRYEPNEQRT